MATAIKVQTPAPTPSVPPNFLKGARHTWHQQRRHRSVLRLLSRIKGTVLDYGCGWGDLTNAISRTHTVEGVDVDSDRVAFAAREYAPIPFSRCEGDTLAYPDRSFDNVASVVVIHFVPDSVQYLREVYRVMKDDGHLLIACKNQDRVRDFFRGLLGRGPSPTKLWIPSKAEMRDALARQGFQIECETWFYDPPFSGWKNIGRVCFGLVEQVLSLFRVKATCGYYVFLAKKVARPSAR